MRRLIGITLLVLFAVAMTVYGQSPATRNPLVGAWRVTEIDDANRPPITNPQPGLSRITTRPASIQQLFRWPVRHLQPLHRLRIRSWIQVSVGQPCEVEGDRQRSEYEQDSSLTCSSMIEIPGVSRAGVMYSRSRVTEVLYRNFCSLFKIEQGRLTSSGV